MIFRVLVVPCPQPHRADVKDLGTFRAVEVVLVSHEHYLATSLPVDRRVGNDDGVRFIAQDDFPWAKRLDPEQAIRVWQLSGELRPCATGWSAAVLIQLKFAHNITIAAIRTEADLLFQ